MRWLPRSADPTQVASLAAELQSNASIRIRNSHDTATLARLLVMRGIADAESAERFLSPSLSHLHSPYLISGLKTAVERIEAAIDRKEGILFMATMTLTALPPSSF